MTIEYVEVAVCGAHMSGLPLNHQLTNLQGELLAKSKTAPFTSSLNSTVLSRQGQVW